MEIACSWILEILFFPPVFLYCCQYFFQKNKDHLRTTITQNLPKNKGQQYQKKYSVPCNMILRVLHFEFALFSQEKIQSSHHNIEFAFRNRTFFCRIFSFSLSLTLHTKNKLAVVMQCCHFIQVPYSIQSQIFITLTCV